MYMVYLFIHMYDRSIIEYYTYNWFIIKHPCKQQNWKKHG